MSIMGNVVGLGAVQSDWAQTDENKADYIRNKPDFFADGGDLSELKALAESALPLKGGTMTGTIDMGYHYITKLSANPKNAHDAVRKDYVDNAVAGAKSYADGKRLSGSVTLTAAGWSGGVQDVQDETVSGILATDMPHWGVVYSSDASTREAEKEAFALVDVLETSAGKFTFRCFGDVPAVALNIQWEVNR